jgi:putative tryptophan/tyrosine transport system permease protein
MTLLVGTWTLGFIYALLALGVFLAFRIFRFADITADGSITLGAAITAILLTQGYSPFVAILLAFLGGTAAGATTGVLHTKFKINPLLSGFLVMTALYSINLRIMGKSNLPVMGTTTLATYADRLGNFLSRGQARVSFLGWEITAGDLAMLLLSFTITAAVGLALCAFLRTDFGTAMRATGDNDQMIRALGVNTDTMLIGGLALSNGLVALAGSLLAQYQGFADVLMGIGMVVLGLASVIMGEALVGAQQRLGLAITGAVLGAVLYRLLVALVLRAGLNANDLKLITAIFVFAALVFPTVLERLRSSFGRRQPAVNPAEKKNAGS